MHERLADLGTTTVLTRMLPRRRMPTGKEPAILTGVGGLFASIVAIAVANRYNS